MATFRIIKFRMSLFRNIFGTNHDPKNLGLRCFLDITENNKEKIKDDFKKAHTNISPLTIDSYFVEYKMIFDYAEKQLVETRKFQENQKQIKSNFISIVSNQYKWLDKSNIEKLYDVCSFYLR